MIALNNAQGYISFLEKEINIRKAKTRIIAKVCVLQINRNSRKKIKTMLKQL